MAGIPKYSAEENLRRISRQKSLKFIVVEGPYDVPIYDYVIRCGADSGVDFDVVHAGGKVAIQEFLTTKKQYGNCMFIVDKDFDAIKLEYDNLVYLDRYSIENYYFCDEVISSAISISLNCKLCDAKKLMSIAEFNEGNKDTLLNLLKAIVYYQNEIAPQRLRGEEAPSWSDTFICNENGWEISRERAEKLIDDIIPENIKFEDVTAYFDRNFELADEISNVFPGKMLKTSLQRYIRTKIREVGTKKLNGKFSNIDTAYELLTAHLHKSPDLKGILLPIKEFVGC